uniref:Uncharacterized protein n=1 Tax=Parascaris univalens TaxID=6257 RepID=A0A915AXR6_PARUN
VVNCSGMRIWWSLSAVLLVCDGKGGRNGGRASSRARFTSSGTDSGSTGSDRGYTAGFSLLGSATRASRSYRNFRSSLRSSMHSNSLRMTGLIIVTNPTLPYYYGGNYYYWSHANYNDRERKRSDRKKCLIHFNETHELDGIYFDENETAPEV